MNRKSMKRIVCAGLAVQMMLTPVAQAAEPLRMLSSARPASAAERQLLAANAIRSEQLRTAVAHTKLTIPSMVMSADLQMETAVPESEKKDDSNISTPSDDSLLPPAPSAPEEETEPDHNTETETDADAEQLPQLPGEEIQTDPVDDPVDNPVDGPDLPGDDSRLPEDESVPGEDDNSDMTGEENAGENGDVDKDQPAAGEDLTPPSLTGGVDVDTNVVTEENMPVDTDTLLEDKAPLEGSLAPYAVQRAISFSGIWAGLEEYFDDDFDCEDDLTWPDWFFYLEYANGDLEGYLLYYDSWGDETWLPPELIPDGFVAGDKTTYPQTGQDTGCPTNPVVHHLLVVAGYDGTKYNYSGEDGNTQVSGFDYNVEQEEPWIENKNYTFKGGVMTKLYKPQYKREETDPWAQIEITFDPKDEDAWPDWFLYLVFYGYDEYENYYNDPNCNWDGTWPEPEKIPSTFDPTKPETFPGGGTISGGAWDPDADDVFSWNDATYLNEDALSTPRIPNLMFDQWYILEDSYAADPIGPASAPYQKYRDAWGGDANPFVDEYGKVTGNYEYEKDVSAYDSDEHIYWGDPWDVFDISRPLEDYTCYMSPSRVFAIIGAWKASDNATATKLTIDPSSSTGATTSVTTNLYAYRAGMENLTADELGGEAPITEETFADTASHTYFARVPYEMDLLNFHLYTYEPGSTLSISVTDANGKAIDFTGTVDQKGETMELVNDLPNNSATNPARGIRSLDGALIPLAPTTADNRYTIVTMTVTAPDGSTEETYTVYVQRLAQPVMQVAPGNTPYGMIDRTPGWSDEKKASVKADFKAHDKFDSSNPGNMPNDGTDSVNDGINNGGFVYTREYLKEAWGLGGTNYDLDSGAIVVYQNATFQVPGFTVYDGLNNPHQEGADGAKVSWELNMTRVDALGPAVASDEYPASAPSYNWSGSTTVNQISLQGYSVKPGVYTLTYTYYDLYDYVYYGDSYGDDNTGHNDSQLGFERKVIVLPLRGDIDMDGEVTPADGVMLRQLLADNYFGFRREMIECTDVAKSLYYFRVCDVNGDGNIDNGDVTALIGSYDTPTYGRTPASRDYYYYLPLLDPAKDKNKPAQKEAEGTSGSAAQLVIEYLGYSEDAADMTKLNKDDPLDYNPGQPGYTGVFWMGAKLTGVSSLPSELQAPLTTFTFTMAYDSAYAEPWTADGYKWEDYIKAANPQWDWSRYDLQSSSGGDLTPVSHDGKAASSLEADDSKRRELRFSISLKDGVDGATLGSLESNYLLKVPFELTAYPRVRLDADSSAGLVEAALGMRDFAVTTTADVTAPGGHTAKAAAGWQNQSVAWVGGDVQTMTINLAGCLDYVCDDARIPIGENNAPSIGILPDGEHYAVYGEYFSVDLTNIVEGDPLTGTVALVSGGDELTAAGVTYNSATHILSGTPTATRLEEDPFKLTLRTTAGVELNLQLVVDKAPLTLTVHDVDKYYGEDNDHTTEKKFTYNISEIKAIDLTPGTSNTGTEEDLQSLMSGYTAPTITLVKSVSDPTELDAETPPGKYTVLLTGGKSANYRFQYSRPATGPSGEATTVIDKESSAATLTIHPRPIRVGKVTRRDDERNPVPLGTVAAQSTQFIEDQISYKKEEFTVLAAEMPDSAAGNYNGIPLSEGTGVVGTDELTLTFYATVSDITNPTSAQEERAAAVTRVAFFQKDGNQNARYVLSTDVPTDRTGTALVTRRKLIKLEVQHAPADMEYTYGEAFSPEGFVVALHFEDDKDHPAQIGGTGGWTQESIADYAAAYGMTLQWVEKNSYTDKDYPQDALDAYRNQLMTLSDQNGKYLCLSIPGVDEQGNAVTFREYFGPFTVNKRVLTLTLKGADRYYGEPNPANWDVTFNKNELAQGDMGKVTTANRAALKTLLVDQNYTEPTISFRKGTTVDSEEVTQRTGIGQYYMLLSGGESDGYTFRYVCSGWSQTESKTTTTAAEPGYAPMQVYPRPIIVTKLITPVVELDYDAPKPSLSTSYTAVVASASERADFSVALPVSGKPYYYSDIDGSKTTKLNYSITGSGVCEWDSLTLQYQLESVETHKEQVPYWDLGDKASINIEIQVRLLEIRDNKNYQLVYASSAAAAKKYTSDADTGAQTAAFGTISMRTTGKVQIKTAPKLAYTYGEPFSFGSFTIQVWPAGQESGAGKAVQYGELSDGLTTFQREGLDVYWLEENGTIGDRVEKNQPLYVKEHTGKKLGIAKADGTVLAETEPVTVTPKPLTVTAVSQTRMYGEENAAYSATLPVADLASWDKKKLVDAGKLEESATEATSVVLSDLDQGYEDLTFTTSAVKTSKVGTYTLNISLNGSMDNYKLTAVAGSITVKPRRIMVTGLNKTPVYSISQNSTVKTISLPEPLKQGKGTDGTVYDELIMRPVDHDGMTGTDPAVLPDDFVAIEMTVTFRDVSDPTDNAVVEVSPTSFKLAEGSNPNYEIHTSNSPFTATGAVQKRRVASVSVYTNNTVMSPTYIYGESLDLGKLQLRLTYATEPGETSAPFEIVSYKEFAAYGISVHYWDDSKSPAKEKWQTIVDELDAKNWQAAAGDHLTIVPNSDGFAHNGKYLLISVKAVPGGEEYIQPLVYENPLSHAAIPLKVNPLPLNYTLAADNKSYDGTTAATGSLTLTNAYPGDDVAVNPSRLKFTFTDAQAGTDIPVEVTGIALIGADKDNYAINAEVKVNTPSEYGRPTVPKASIYASESRPAPAVTVTLTVDAHTNTVMVKTDKPASSFPEGIYEYALVDETGAIIADYQPSPYFGGELVTVDGAHQAGLRGDTGFGERAPLSRGTYVGALVRLAATRNYKETDSTRSYTDFQEAKAEAEQLPEVTEKEKLPERKEGAVIRTYTYRFTLIATEEQKDSAGKTNYNTRLDAVWFTDIDLLNSEKDLSRLVDDLTANRYTAFAWDAAQKVKLTYPLQLTDPIMVKLPVEQEDGTTAEEECQVNKDNNLDIYVSTKRSSSGSGGGNVVIPLQGITIEPSDLELHLGDDPVKLKVIYTPKDATERHVTWTSSDETVVTVSASGLVTVVGVGTAVITAATSNGITDSITVRVLPVYEVPFQDTMFNTDYRGTFIELANGLFEPERRLTRAELTVIMEHFFQQVDHVQPGKPERFSDVPEEASYLPQIETLNKWGIVEGIGEGLYAPDRYVTRAEISAILCRMLMLPVSQDPAGPHAFLDAGPEDTWAWAYIDALAKAGITVGTGDNMYNPERVLTRAEVATMLSRALVTTVDMDGKALIIPRDVTKEHWAYEYILRAVNSGNMLLVKKEYVR